ncbi:hypothetical protein BOX15_Mlig031246g2 [Macrostomum lignano]|uniref:Uncharacterized protein n=1 Tax=Macrostomum lignano TaxID=282301 RepID=A0A267G2F5_9PLAT|nr:hypothetical protein BOX15_Mlig031246g3 [Macrostomum lignano]PAA84623.1 hypothetical protein BOX15_Mlig031246g2 [Macrostomum lignano]
MGTEMSSKDLHSKQLPSRQAHLFRRRISSLVFGIALLASTGLVAGATAARAVQCPASVDCPGQRGRLHFALMLSGSALFIGSLAGLLILRYIVFGALPPADDTAEFEHLSECDTPTGELA